MTSVVLSVCEAQKPMAFGDLGLRNVTLIMETVLRMARMLCEGFQQGFQTLPLTHFGDVT